uniref:Luciferin 4-monooxygenase-like isoform X1 n=2 Tax=Diabrotica virgifera virgifera TaxID=50390 RepID=A0A6P7FA79_DIAVI
MSRRTTISSDIPMFSEGLLHSITSSYTKNLKMGISSINSIHRAISMSRVYGGLGLLYYDRLESDLDKILQVDINTTRTETRGTVKERSIKLALEMSARGIKEKDIIVICSQNNVDETIVILASLFLGAIVAPLDPEASYKEKELLIKKLRPKMCFVDSRTLTYVQRILHNNKLRGTAINFSVESSGISEFSKLLNHKEDEKFRPVNIADPKRTVAFILPTQGTTDFPKLVCVSHDNIRLQCLIFIEIFPDLINVLSFFPLSWYFHLVIICVCLEFVVTLIIPRPFNERNGCKIIQDFNVECIIIGTDYAIRLFHGSAAKDFNLNCLKSVLIGLNSTLKHDMFSLKQSMPKVMFVSSYFLVETGCIAATKTIDYNSIIAERPMTVGSVTLNCKVKIIDVKTKEICPPRKYGEIYYTGDGLMLGYFKDPEKTLQSREKGYFRTGDIGMFDELGWLYVLGRFEDMIEFDEWSLSPMDIEEVILRHPAVKDAVVVGNAKEVVALVKKYPDAKFEESDLTRHIGESLPSKYWPSRIILQDHFPRTTVGSVRRKKIREDLLQVTVRYSSSMSVVSELATITKK